MNTNIHATTDQLLDYKDGEATTVDEHIASCEHCLAELYALKSIGQQWFAMADQAPSTDTWQKIQSSLDNDSSNTAVVAGGQAPQTAQIHTLHTSPYQSLSKAIYALAASVAFVGVVAVFMFSQQQSTDQQTQMMQASINQLMMNSRGLEQALQNVVLQTAALSEANQKVADRLYWKLSYVDQLIHEVSPDNAERVKVLWNDRIQALNELNQIYYERDSARNTSEI